MFGAAEASFLIIPIVSLLITLVLVVIVLTLFARLVRAVEKIADKTE